MNDGLMIEESLKGEMAKHQKEINYKILKYFLISLIYFLSFYLFFVNESFFENELN